MKAWTKFTWILALVSLLILLPGAQIVAADDDDKNIPSGTLNFPAEPGRTERHFLLNWTAPEQTSKLKDYHVRWTVNSRANWNSCGEFISLKKSNTAKKGNALINSDTTSYLLYVPVRWGETLMVQIRARYRGETNGDWAGVRWMNDGYLQRDNTDTWRQTKLPIDHPHNPNRVDEGAWPADYPCSGFGESNS